MRIKDSFKDTGFTLLEVIAAAVILTTVGIGIVKLYTLEPFLAVNLQHRVEALNYAQSIAEILLERGSGLPLPQELNPGLHTQTTDPAICTLPDAYFKTYLKGVLKYNVEDVPIIGDPAPTAKARKVEIIVEWEEISPPKVKKKENLFIVPYCKQW